MKGALLVAAVVLLSACGRAPDAAVPAAGAVTAITITTPAPGTPFAKTFAWKPIAGATSYQVVVFSDANGTRAFEVRDLTTAGVKVGDSVQLAPGDYLMQVTALRNGATVAESKLEPLLIR